MDLENYVWRHGKGKAYYIAAETNKELLSWVIEEASADIDVGERFELPYGVQARKIAKGQYFYINMNKYPVKIETDISGKGVLKGATVNKELVLDRYESELVIADEAEENHL